MPNHKQRSARGAAWLGMLRVPAKLLFPDKTTTGDLRKWRNYNRLQLQDPQTYNRAEYLA